MSPEEIEDRILDVQGALHFGDLEDGHGPHERANLLAELEELQAAMRDTDAYHEAMQAARIERDL